MGGSRETPARPPYRGSVALISATLLTLFILPTPYPRFGRREVAS